MTDFKVISPDKITTNDPTLLASFISDILLIGICIIIFILILVNWLISLTQYSWEFTNKKRIKYVITTLLGCLSGILYGIISSFFNINYIILWDYNLLTNYTLEIISDIHYISYASFKVFILISFIYRIEIIYDFTHWNKWCLTFWRLLLILLLIGSSLEISFGKCEIKKITLNNNINKDVSILSYNKSDILFADEIFLVTTILSNLLVVWLYHRKLRSLRNDFAHIERFYRCLKENILILMESFISVSFILYGIISRDNTLIMFSVNMIIDIFLLFLMYQYNEKMYYVIFSCLSIAYLKVFGLYLKTDNIGLNTAYKYARNHRQVTSVNLANVVKTKSGNISIDSLENIDDNDVNDYDLQHQKFLQKYHSEMESLSNPHP